MIRAQRVRDVYKREKEAKDKAEKKKKKKKKKGKSEKKVVHWEELSSPDQWLHLPSNPRSHLSWGYHFKGGCHQLRQIRLLGLDRRRSHLSEESHRSMAFRKSKRAKSLALSRRSQQDQGGIITALIVPTHGRMVFGDLVAGRRDNGQQWFVRLL
ncbi:MAG: hypothetical protein ALECFALPRED_008385 [Alectoria fallacina]|uniref:Uncharacterized protein n=1 Tax=Alectoria fallacina TaxID=1903189 RepID=A0A8H3J3A4_9LECA|nr:MAG: hypothetical protein ALECFALPRED_008385 [Alectoria fallacina]